MPDIVVLVVAYDSGPRLGACVQSALEQQPRPQVLVVDNASRDGSVDALPAGVRVLRRATNDGYAAAVRDGLAASTAPLVFTLNPDARLLPGCLAAAQQVLRAHSDVASVAPLVLLADGSGRIDALGVGLTSGLGILNHAHGLPAVVAPDESEPVLAPLGGAALWRRDALLAAGGFDPWPFLYWEDVDVALRLHHMGFRCLTAPAARVLHEGSGIVGRWSPLNVFHMVRNHAPCLLGALPAPVLRRRWPRLLAAPVRAAVLYALRGRPLAAAAGLLASLALLPAAARRRAHLHGDAADAAARLLPLLAGADRERRRMKAAARGAAVRGEDGATAPGSGTRAGDTARGTPR